tara:strand:- start:21976 stop:23031 length:1056 start_codon:yes stop_codon:yes gene_type:complete
MYENVVPPHYCLAFTYNTPQGSTTKGKKTVRTGGPTFQHHFESKHRWGEVLIGVSLGLASCLHFISTDGQTRVKETGEGVRDVDWGQKFSVEVTLPRRSIYIMSGDSRHLWRHGIKLLDEAEHDAPVWNKACVRRSQTLRAFKPYSNSVLRARLGEAQSEAEKQKWKARIAAQDKFKTRYDGSVYLDQDAADSWRQVIQTNPVLKSRFSQQALGFFGGSGQTLGAGPAAVAHEGGGGGGGDGGAPYLPNTAYDEGDAIERAEAASLADLAPGGSQVAGKKRDARGKQKGESNLADDAEQTRRARLARFGVEEQGSQQKPVENGGVGGESQENPRVLWACFEMKMSVLNCTS